MKIPLSWLREFVDLPESVDELAAVMDDLGLVVEGIERIGEGLEDIVVARIDEIRAIDGADRVRLVVVDAGQGPLEIVCGATNFSLHDYVPLAPIGAVLPGGFEIARRHLRGVTSNGMLCSARELGLSDDHEGLLILDTGRNPQPGEPLMTTLGLVADVVLDISIEGNRPDAWSLLGVARDLATRFDRELHYPRLAQPISDDVTSSVASATVDAPDLCGRLTVSVMRNVIVGPSPAHIAQRLTMAGMRPISNVVDASNIVMLELGQPTHPYDADFVGGATLRARVARPGEVLTTLDGVERPLAQPGRGLGDSGDDLLIVDGDDVIHGLAGIMGGALGEIRDTTTAIIFEAAFFDPMTIARSSKRHGLRSEASNRFERGVDPELALLATARFVAVLSESVPNLEWLCDPLDIRGDLPKRPTITMSDADIERTLGVAIARTDVVQILRGLNFVVDESDDLAVTAPPSRLDIRFDRAGCADVIEEVARLYSYSRLPRRTPTWSEPGGWTASQRCRRTLRDTAVAMGMHDAWTATLISQSDHDVTHPHQVAVRVTNPLVGDEAVLRASLLVGLVRAWGRNVERGWPDVVLGEIGVAFTHPDVTTAPRRTRGGVGGTVSLALPSESEHLSIVLGRHDDDARTAVAFAHALLARCGLDVVIRSEAVPPSAWHPTRTGLLLERHSGAVLGRVGEIDPTVIDNVAHVSGRRLGVIDLDVSSLVDEMERATHRDVTVPSRFPSATLDLAFVTPDHVGSDQVVAALLESSELIEDVRLFDVYRGESVAASARSLAFSVRLCAADRTLSDKEIAAERANLIAAVSSLGATLRA